MRHTKLSMLLVALVVMGTMLACSFSGGEKAEESKPTEKPAAAQPAEPTKAPEAKPTEAPTAEAAPTEAPTSKPALNVESEFPMAADAQNIMVAQKTLNYQTKMSLTEVADFYRAELGKRGMKEDKLLTSTTDTTLSMVFRGGDSEKPIVVQAVDLGNKTINVNVRYEDV